MDAPREDLGQHLLRDPEAIARILAAADLRPGEFVLDAGAGRGALTHPMAQAVGPAGRVLAVELDPRMIADLRVDLPPHVEVVAGDILEVPLPRDLDAVVANPPFKVLAPFIERLAAAHVPRAVLVVPAELAERLTAPPGSERFGFLTVRVGVLAEVTWKGPVSRRAFRPAPTVACAILALRARAGAVAPDPEALRVVFEAVTAGAKRKAKYALARLPDTFRSDSARFQQFLRDEAWAEQVAGTLPPPVLGAIARHFQGARS